MHRVITTISLFVAASLGAPSLHTRKTFDFTGVTVIGDSLCDDGRAPGSAWLFTNRTLPADPNYFNSTARRFSNSCVWTERLAGKLGVPLTDYAVGGATSNNSFVPGVLGSFIVPDALQQYAKLTAALASEPKDISKELFIVYIGGNDGIQSVENNLNPNRTITYDEEQVGQRIVSVIEWIVSHLIHSVGVKHLFLSTTPNTSRTPLGSTLGSGIQTHQTSMNSYYYPYIEELKLSIASAGVELTFVDYYNAMDPVFDDPTGYNFSAGATVPCVVGTYGESGYSLCSTDPDVQDTHFFWDYVHPTGPGHEIIAQIGYNALSTTYGV
ncbi:hypothetical protein FRB95_004042 [Tulasnella sp. JGI-2019a]|nr:hypothetical protein FRB95_004042 [Tulasnella sp. JGI-2019a]